MRAAGFAMLVLCAVISGAAAQPTGGMAAMQYFVGSWACKATPAGGSTLDVFVNFVMDSGIMRERDEVTIPGNPVPYTISKSITYDQKNGRWVQAQLDGNGAWIVSTLKPWTGNTEEWLDEASSDGKLGRNETIRTSANEFGFRGYANPTDKKPNLDGICTRST
ncbi:MAG: hypothetical protein V4513_03840 [Pseudomonadota bacterium]